MMKSIRKRKQEKGFTLTEMVVVMVILAVMSGGILMFLRPVTDLWMYQGFRQGPLTESRLAAVRMIREMNQVADRFNVIDAAGNRFQFIDVNGTNITYSLNVTDLERNGVVFANNISALTFQYYNQNSAVIATPVESPGETDLRRIEVSVTVTRGGRTNTIRLQAQPRNLFG